MAGGIIDRRRLLAGSALTAAALGLGLDGSPASTDGERWSLERAAAWAAAQPWRVGCNYIPSTAVNQLEMWQSDTFDPTTIDRELGWAAGIGMNAVRVFLHDLPWEEDPSGFRQRIDTFLSIAARHGIATLLVFFDSCWDPFPRPGPQPPPRPGVHNSRWVQSPGAVALGDRTQWPRLADYVSGVLSGFRDDPRVLAWDLWNEPDNCNGGSYGPSEPSDKLDRVADLLPQAFAWARAAHPAQPLTSPVWQGHDWSAASRLGPIERIQLALSDVLSFHSYEPPPVFEACIASLRAYGRPILCTEYMARPLGSTVESILPIAKQNSVATFNWGLVAGKTQTTLAWNTWQTKSVAPATVWFHDLFDRDGIPYSPGETAVIQQLGLGKAQAQ